MKRSQLGLLVVVLALSLFPVAASAGTVIGSVVSGPGGAGFDGGSFSNVTEPVLQYSGIDYLDVMVTVDSAGVYNVNEAPGLGGISNFTGQHWTAFQITNLTPDFGSLAGDWSYYTSPFGAISNSPNLVVASGGLGVDSGSGMAMLGNYVTNGPGTFILREIPIPTPEPSAITLLGTALVALGARAWRRRKVS